MADYIYLMESRLLPEQQRGATMVQEIARAHQMNIYLTGGAIRDMVSGLPIRDLDFAVEGNPSKLHKDLEKAGCLIEGEDEDARELYLRLPGNVRAAMGMARSEKFLKPGKPPEISPASIMEDLRRRDFTVNAIALSLNPGSRGLLLDPSNGLADIESKLIRILHNYSFLEDPSRLIRATRFASRFHWTLEERTQARYDAAKEGDYIKHISDHSAGRETEQIAYEDDPLHIMRALEKEGWLRLLHPHWSVAKVDPAGLAHLLKTRQQMTDLGYAVHANAAVMYFLTARLNERETAEMQKHIPRKGFVQAWRNLENEAKEMAHRLGSKEGATPSRAWQLLSQSRPETIAFLETTSRQQSVLLKVRNFLTKWRQVKQRFPLPEMAEMRITPEAEFYPKLVDQMFLLMLDGKLKTSTEIKKFLKPYEPPPPPPPPPPPSKRRIKAEVKAEKVTTPPPAGGKEKVKGKLKDKALAPTTAPVAATPAPAPVAAKEKSFAKSAAAKQSRPAALKPAKQKKKAQPKKKAKKK
jgi:tRNA nucleotidyltransferase (CCA-adding enzyme)